jgi:hypothetical protein
MTESSPQSHMPLPHDETSCWPMQTVAVLPHIPSVTHFPGEVWQPAAQAQSAGQLVESSPQSHAPSPQLASSLPTRQI